MGFIYADITLSNPGKRHLKPIAVRAMVDTGAMMLCVPEHIAVQLQLDEFEKREVTTADESRHVVSHVGPILIRFDNRHSITGALVIGQSLLLGAIALQDMDVVISPTRETITSTPRAPTSRPQSSSSAVLH